MVAKASGVDCDIPIAAHHAVSIPTRLALEKSVVFKSQNNENAPKIALTCGFAKLAVVEVIA